MAPAYIPSPPTGVVHVGPLPLRAYALCIIVGVVLAVWIGDRRWVARGGEPGTVADVAGIAVPAGLVGARLYHVITTPGPYLDAPLDALKVWEGGLGIWGAIAGGAVGAWFALRRRGVRFLPFLDALAPALPVAQGVGRVGNWFNQELFGRPTTLPWGLEIAPDNPDAVPGAEAYHPTFLYELLWNLGVAGLVVWADRRWRLGAGRAFALYVAAYCAGRLWIEALRIDDAHRFLGLRLNEYVAGALLLGAVAYLVARRGAPREDDVRLDRSAAGSDAALDDGTGAERDATPDAGAGARSGTATATAAGTAARSHADTGIGTATGANGTPAGTDAGSAARSDADASLPPADEHGARPAATEVAPPDEPRGAP